jgi:hypothetical protein
MTVNEYKARVIAWFQSGMATDTQWQEMAEAVLVASENEVDAVPEIDRVVNPDSLMGDPPALRGAAGPARDRAAVGQSGLK